MRAPKSVEVGLDLKVFSIKGTWEPNDTERRAAWELYVELVTRVTVVPLTDGIAREGLTSLYAVFGQAREILRRYGPEVAEPKPDGLYKSGVQFPVMCDTSSLRCDMEHQAFTACRA